MSITLRELRSSHAEKLKRIKAFSVKDNLSESENREVESLYKETQSLKDKIEKRERIRDIELETRDDRPWEKENRSYSLNSAIAVLLGDNSIDSGFEREVDQELRSKHRNRSQAEKSVMIPSDSMWGSPKKETRQVSNQQALIQQTIKWDQYTPALYEKSMFQELGVRMISNDGKFSFPKSSGVTSNWFTGTGGSNSQDSISESDPTYTEIVQEPHFLAVYTGWTIKQIKNMMSSPSLESLLREDLMGSMQARLFSDFLTNAGTANTSPPRGIVPSIPSGNNTAKSLASNALWKNSDFLGALQKLKANLKNNSRNFKWLFSVADEALLKNTRKLEAGSTDSKVLWENNQVSDFPAYSTNNLVNNAVVGDWNEAILSDFGTVEIELGYINDDLIKGIKRIKATGCYDFALRRDEAFQKFTITRA